VGLAGDSDDAGIRCKKAFAEEKVGLWRASRAQSASGEKTRRERKTQNSSAITNESEARYLGRLARMQQLLVCCGEGNFDEAERAFVRGRVEVKPVGGVVRAIRTGLREGASSEAPPG